MSSDINGELLDEVKNFLDITWNDEAGDKKIVGFIRRGMKRIDELCGKEFDYSSDDDAEAKELLLNYVMYARSNALDEFFKNYQTDIIYLQTKQEALSYAQKNS